MEPPKVRKIKKPNFSEKEIDALLSGVSLEYSILVSKLQSSVTVAKKRSVWEGITQKVNAIGGFARDLESIKKKWKDLKSAVVTKHSSSAKGTSVIKPLAAIPYEDIVSQIIGSSSCLASAIEGGLDTFCNSSKQSTFEEQEQEVTDNEDNMYTEPQISNFNHSQSILDVTQSTHAHGSLIPVAWNSQSTPNSTNLPIPRPVSCQPIPHLPEVTIAVREEDGTVTIKTEECEPVEVELTEGKRKKPLNNIDGPDESRRKKRKNEIEALLEELAGSSLLTKYLKSQIEKNETKNDLMKLQSTETAARIVKIEAERKLFELQATETAARTVKIEAKRKLVELQATETSLRIRRLEKDMVD